MGEIISTEGVILRIYDYKDAGIKTRILTPNGYEYVIIRGAKKLSSKTRCLNGELIQLSYNRTNKITYTMTGFSIIDNFTSIKEDKDKYYVALMILEKLIILERAISDYTSLYTVVLKTLNLLTTTLYPESLLFVFETKLTYLLGIAPMFKTCCICGKEVDNSFFQVSSGGVICDCCKKDEVVSLNSSDTKLLFYCYYIKLEKITDDFLALITKSINPLRQSMNEYYEQYMDFHSRVDEVYNKI